MSPELLEQLISYLDDLLRLHRRAATLSERKRSMLVALDLEGLHCAVRSQQEIESHIPLMEEAIRQTATRLLAPYVGSGRLGRDVLLRRIIEIAPEPAASRIAMIRTELLDACGWYNPTCTPIYSEMTSLVTSDFAQEMR